MIHFDEWRTALEPIGHPDNPFRRSDYQLDSRMPVQGFVEWIADAWLDDDTDSISRLMAELVRPPEIVARLSVQARQVTSENDELSVRYDISIDRKPGPAKGAEAYKLSEALRLPDELRAVDPGRGISNLDGRELANLIGAFIMEIRRTGGRQRSWFCHRAAGQLMAATALHSDFRVEYRPSALRYFNRLVALRREADGQRLLPCLTRQQVESASPPAPVQALLRKTRPLSSSARLHLLDVLHYQGYGFKARRLEDCTLYETRTFGCNERATASELLQLGLINTAPSIVTLRKWFAKSRLMDFLRESRIPFKTTASLTDLWELAERHLPGALQSIARGEGASIPTTELMEGGKQLSEFAALQAFRLIVWSIAWLTPQLYALDGRGVNTHTADDERL